MAYRIGELARKLGVSEHTLRFYESKGLVVPKRDSNNIRYYEEDQKRWMEFILHMKDTGMQLDDLKKYIDLWASGRDGIPELLDMLYEHKAVVTKKLATYQSNLTMLSNKISFYEQNLEDEAFNMLYEEFIKLKQQEGKE
ncbi:MerR family transcriptional regulator [Alkalicoccobacillus gibsonii]|uniref:MerR family transcriptional regulator n=1 Tax=Alkalicoccobacillus gibsonii TaxID=79881 RepID=UPI003F7B77FA